MLGEDDLDYMARFKERLDELDTNLTKLNFRACSNASTDLIRASEFVGYSEGVFIGEFFESLFNNLASVTYRFKVEKDVIESIKNEILKLVQLIKKSIPTKDVSVKSELYDTMVKMRYVVTAFQIKNFREGERKKGRIPERFESREGPIEY